MWACRKEISSKSVIHLYNYVWCPAAVMRMGCNCTGWRRLIGSLIFMGHFPQKSPIFSGSFVHKDLQLSRLSSPKSATYIDIYVYIYIYTCIYIYIYTYIYTYTCIYISIYICIQVYIFTTDPCEVEQHPPQKLLLIFSLHIRTYTHTHVYSI